MSKYQFIAKYATKKLCQNSFLGSECIFKVAENQNIYILEIPGKITIVLYLHVILFKIQERGWWH